MEHHPAGLCQAFRFPTGPRPATTAICGKTSGAGEFQIRAAIAEGAAEEDVLTDELLGAEQRAIDVVLVADDTAVVDDESAGEGVDVAENERAFAVSPVSVVVLEMSIFAPINVTGMSFPSSNQSSISTIDQPAATNFSCISTLLPISIVTRLPSQASFASSFQLLQWGRRCAGLGNSALRRTNVLAHSTWAGEDASSIGLPICR